MTIRLEFNRIAPGVEIGPHRHGVESIVYLAGGELVFEHGDFGSVTFTVTEVEVAPGHEDAWHLHPGSEHAIVVFEGRGSIQVGGVEEVLEPLKGIRILPGRRHRVRNDGRHRLRYYVCASPGTDPTIDRVPAEGPRRRLDA